MAFLPDRRTIGVGIESSPYTAESLSASDYNVEAKEISYSPEIEEYARKIARGDFSPEVSVMGKMKFACSFKVDVAEGATVATAPTSGKLKQACGLNETVHGATGVSYISHSDYSNVPVTIEIVEKDEGTSPDQLVIRGKGCMGNVKWILDAVGNPCREEYEFQGALVTITHRAFGSIVTPTGFNDQNPSPVLGVSITAYGEVRTIGSFTIDLGNDVQIFSDPADDSGYQGAHIVTRRTTAELDPDMELITTHNDFTRWSQGTTGVLSLQTEDNIVLSMPAAQILSDYTPGDREGHTTKSMSILATRSSGNDEFKFLQGSEL